MRGNARSLCLWRRLGLAVLFAFASGFIIIGCDQENPARNPASDVSSQLPRELVVYVSTDEAIARPILDAFSEETGIAVRARYDSENSKTTALAAMLRAERSAPRADVFWSGECFAPSQLGYEGVMTAWRCARGDQFPDAMRGEAGKWYGFAPRVRVLVYDPRAVTADRLPTSMLDLAKPAFAKMVAMADPRFGTTRGHIGAFASEMERREGGSYGRWLKGFANNRPKILAGGNASVVDAVMRGEALLGLTDSDDAYAAMTAGGSIAFLPLRQFSLGESGGGAMLIPNSVSMVADAPHPAEANEFMLYMFQPKVSRWLHESRSGNLIVLESGAEASSASDDAPPLNLPMMSAVARSNRLDSVEDPFLFEEAAVTRSIDESVIALRRTCAEESAK